VVATSVIAYPEARAALARLRREGGLTSSEYRRAKTDLDRDWVRFLRVPAGEEICRRAGDLAEREHLRGFDSVHLACYLTLLAERGAPALEFSSFDAALNRAAAKLAQRP